jgi:hypothetical protein
MYDGGGRSTPHGVQRRGKALQRSDDGGCGKVAVRQVNRSTVLLFIGR